MKKLFKKKKKRMTSDFSLQITSMADIFMILLVFLLKSYATSLTTISPSTPMALPEVTAAQGVPKEALKVEIGKNIILVDNKPVTKLNNFEFAADEVASGDASPSITQVLDRERRKLPEPNLDSALVVMADEGTPYSTIKRVVASAAGAGFVDLQLVVVQPQ